MENKEIKNSLSASKYVHGIKSWVWFFSIITVQQGLIFEACLLLIVGSFDSVDGRIARLTGTNSSFGEQFDSISTWFHLESHLHF